MTSDMTIQPLAPDAPAIAQIAAWRQALWGHHEPGLDMIGWIADLRRECQGVAVPSVWVALIGDRIVGTGALVVHDGDIRMDLSPWLASVFVPPACRRRGIASALVRHIETRAMECGYARLYLFTPDQQALYRRLGWLHLEERSYCGEQVSVMQRNLLGHAPRDGI